MENLIESIRLAVANGATDEQRTTGSIACRTILTSLEAKPGHIVQAPPSIAEPIAALATALKTLPPEQVLDIAIAKLRSMLPTNLPAPSVASLRFQMLPVPHTIGGVR